MDINAMKKSNQVNEYTLRDESVSASSFICLFFLLTSFSLSSVDSLGNILLMPFSPTARYTKTA
jgi:hypothetical protein